MLLIILVGVLTLALNVVPPVKAIYTVHPVPGEGHFQTIQDAIDNADMNVSDQIWVASGFTYDEDIVVTKPWKIRAWPSSNPADTIICGTGTTHVVTLAANDTRITDFTIKNSGEYKCGIYIQDTSFDNTISNNIITDNSNGIIIEGRIGIENCSARQTILSNNITANEWSGIRVWGYQHNISQNTIVDNLEGIGGNVWNTILNDNMITHARLGSGISLQGSNNTIKWNVVLNTTGPGLSLSSAGIIANSNNTIEYNILSQNSIGIKLNSANLSYVGYNTIYNGDCAVKLQGNSSANTIVGNVIRATTPQTQGIHLDFCCNNTVMENYVENGLDGIYLYNSSHNNILDNEGNGNKFNIRFVDSNNNTATNNSLHSSSAGWGMYLLRSNENQIWNNIMRDNKNGLQLNFSSRNLIAANDMHSNIYFGLNINSSGNNTLIDNNLRDNKYNFGVWGSSLSHFNHSIDTSNTVNERDIWYLTNQKDLVIDNSNVGYLALINCTSITARCLDLNKNLQGVLLTSTNNSKIEISKLYDNYYGICMLWSKNNTVSRNSIRNTQGEYGEGYGMYLLFSNKNTIVENGIENNKCGIHLHIAAHNNITHNNIQYNENTIAMYLWTSWDNTIYNNNFYTTNIGYYGLMPNNWNYSNQGNYWHDDVEGPINLPGNIDYHPLERPVMSELVGDFNYDGEVDIFDIVMIAGAYGSVPSHDNWNIFVDLREPYGKIDIYDVVAACNKYGDKWCS